MYNQYQTPPDYSIPSPYGPRQHNWAGGSLDEGSQYHGPNYYRPSYRMPWKMRPLNGSDLSQTATLVLFSSIIVLVYPELQEEFSKLLQKKIKEDGQKEAKKKLAQCIDKHLFVSSVEEVPSPDDDIEVLRQFAPRESVEKVLACFRGGLNLAYVVPAVAAVGVLAWFVFKKKGRK